MQSAHHEKICTYLRALFRERFANDPTTIVLGDVLVDWATDEMRDHGPDVAIIFNIQQAQDWSTFREAEEGTKPILIIEVTSPSAYSADLETKVVHYAQSRCRVVRDRKHRYPPRYALKAFTGVSA